MSYRNGKRGFSLVELLAVVLILAVLAAVAVPIYLNTRRTAAARSCKGNLAAIAAAESAKALRDGLYHDMAGLQASGPEMLAPGTRCPLDGASYTITDSGGPVSGTTANQITIACPNAATHATAVGVAGDYSRTMPAIVADTVP